MRVFTARLLVCFMMGATVSSGREYLAVSAEQMDGGAKGAYYEVVLKNLDGEKLENLYMDYRVYCRSKARETSMYAFGLDQFIGSIPPNGEKRIRLPGYCLDSVPAGVVLRIYGLGGGGIQPMYEISIPEELHNEIEWNENPIHPRNRPFIAGKKAKEYFEGMRLHKERKYKKAIELLERAGKKGTLKAYYCIGLTYESGSRGGPQADYAKAVKYYKKSCSDGDYSAVPSMAELYFKGGHGLEKSDALALEWLKKGAEEDSPGCLTWLAGYYGANEDKSKRNGALAAEYADRAIVCGVSLRYTAWRTKLAAAYAENGQFDYAIYLQQTVVDFADKENHSKATQDLFRQTLEKYRRGEAY